MRERTVTVRISEKEAEVLRQIGGGSVKQGLKQLLAEHRGPARGPYRSAAPG
jgi:hypothetical protein